MGITSTSTSSGGSYYYLLPRFLFRAILVVGFVCLLVVGSIGRVSNGGTRKIVATQKYWSSSSEGDKNGQVVKKGRDNNNKGVNHEELDYFNYMSKRRVPNGPDPIHNRRAGNSGRPPGQA